MIWRRSTRRKRTLLGIDPVYCWVTSFEGVLVFRVLYSCRLPGPAGQDLPWLCQDIDRDTEAAVLSLQGPVLERFQRHHQRILGGVP